MAGLLFSFKKPIRQSKYFVLFVFSYLQNLLVIHLEIRNADRKLADCTVYLKTYHRRIKEKHYTSTMSPEF